jgi:hypothetical protein
MDAHHVAHYSVAAALAAGVAFLGWHWDKDARTQVNIAKPGGFGFAEVAKEAVVRVRGAWPGLGQDKTIKLGEALRAAGPAKVVIFCPGDACKALMSDIDDALQIAGWTDEEETSPLAVGAGEPGLMVGPAGPKADALKAALERAGLGPVRVVPAKPDGADLDLIIGKMERIR